MIVSFVWLIACIPVVTVGLATIAMYYSVVKVVRYERGYVLTEFLSALKREWKQGILFSILYIAAYALLYLDYLVWDTYESAQGLILSCVCIVIVVIVTATACYLFPLLSRFELSFRDTVKMTAFLAFRYLPTTVVLLLIVAASVIMVSANYAFILFVPGVAAMLSSVLLEKIFRRLTPEPEEGQRQWYDGEDKEEQNEE